MKLPRPFSGPDYHENAAACAPGQEPCVLCGEPLRTAKYEAHVVAGGAEFATGDTPFNEDDAGDMGWYFVGPECARKIPLAYRSAVPASAVR